MLHAQIDRLEMGRFAAQVLSSDLKAPGEPKTDSVNGREIARENWRALLDSNQWPSASETDALSI